MGKAIGRDWREGADVHVEARCPSCRTLLVAMMTKDGPAVTCACRNPADRPMETSWLASTHDPSDEAMLPSWTLARQTGAQRIAAAVEERVRKVVEEQERMAKAEAAEAEAKEAVEKERKRKKAARIRCLTPRAAKRSA